MGSRRAWTGPATVQQDRAALAGVRAKDLRGWGERYVRGFQRAIAAFLAICWRFLADNFSARALPPFNPPGGQGQLQRGSWQGGRDG